MSTDRELLEWAAKAAGETLEFKEFGDILMPVRVVGGESQHYCWNPLRSNGQAMELAISCGLSIEPYPYYDMPKHSVIVKQRRRGDQMRETNPTEVVEVYGDDPAAATRRAIVRAAASIGQQMEK